MYLLRFFLKKTTMYWNWRSWTKWKCMSDFILFVPVKFYESTFLSSPICNIRISYILAHSKTYAIKDHDNIIVFFLCWSQFLQFVVIIKGLKLQISFLDYVISIILWRTFINKCNLQWKVILLVNSSTLLLRTMKLVTILIMNSFSFSQK